MYSREGGQTLLELIVVAAVSVIVVSALVFAIIAALRNASFSKNQAQATKLAQEGIERVRVGRDRDQRIQNLPTTGTQVNSWNGTSNSTCSGSDAKVDSIWCYQIYNSCSSGVPGTACYLKLISDSVVLTWVGSSPTFPTSGTEDIYLDGRFKRAIIISDNSSTYLSQKTVTVIVRWHDFSGPHESRLTTILRRIQ